MKSIYRSLGAVFIGLMVAFSGLLLPVSPAHAFCVYNDSDHVITAAGLPLKNGSFAQTIQPQDSACCNWSNNSCVAESGRYGKTFFAIYDGDGTTSGDLHNWQIEQDLEIAADIIEIVIAALELPEEPEDLVDIIEAGTDLIQTVANQSKLPFSGRCHSGQTICDDYDNCTYEPGYCDRNDLLDVVQTWNGGIVDFENYESNDVYGCWIGYCWGQNKNIDHTKGIPTVTTQSLHSVATKKCLDIRDGSTTNGQTAQVYTCQKSNNQEWYYDGNSVDNLNNPTILTSAMDRNKCLDVNYGDTANGTKVQIWDCGNGNNQKWNFNDDGTITTDLDDYKCLDVVGSEVKIWDCDGSESQQWKQVTDRV
jgi:hypothetical protein